MKKKNTSEKELLHAVGKAIADFKMIKNNDRLLVCLSGGKDSWTMLDILLKLQKKAPINFEIIALNIDPGFQDYDNNKIADYCKKNNISLEIVKTNIKEIITEKKRPGSSYCSFCARLRRGAIYTAAQKLKATKIVLGHHLDDLLETLFLNLFHSGQLKSMAPIMKTDDKKNMLIRPLIYAEESLIATYAKHKFPIILANCPLSSCNDKERAKMKKLITKLDKEQPNIRTTMLNALKNVIPSHLLDKKLFNFGNV